MDFDGFIPEYAADGAEWEGEIWIFGFQNIWIYCRIIKFKIGTHLHSKYLNV